jgi:uncharacterized membrane-anchored protein YjiN (DUF445 family)
MRCVTLAGMKRLSLALLVGMLALTAACIAWRHELAGLVWVRAFAEAAAVGALADWFAVTALFRHPMGLPVPHTAIIPRNKDRIGAALGDFVMHNFLTPAHIVPRVASARPARSAARWLLDTGNRQRACALGAAAAGWVLQRLDDPVARRFLRDWLSRWLRGIDTARAAGDLLEVLVARSGHQSALLALLPQVDAWLQANRDWVRQQVRAGSRLTPGFLDDYIADRLVDGAVDLLHAMADDPAHPLRKRLQRAARDAAQALQHSPRWRRGAAAVTRWLAMRSRDAGCGERLWEALHERLQADLASPQSALRTQAEAAVAALARELETNLAMQDKLDLWVLQAVEAAVLRHGHHAAGLISAVVNSWDAQEVSRKLEAEIGRDLQFIRINGTVVGGLAGLAIHAAGTLLA